MAKKKTRATVTRAKKPKLSPAPYQLMPLLEPAAFRALKRDIAKRGVLVPIERDETGELLDGHHRVRAWEELKREGIHVEMPVILRLDLSESEKRAHVRSVNLLRRQLTQDQRRAVIEDQLRDTPERSDRAIAQGLAVAPSTVGIVRRRLGERESTVRFEQSERVGQDGRKRRLPKPRSISAPSGADAERARVDANSIPRGVLPERNLTAGEVKLAARLIRQESAREAQMERMRDPGPLPHGRIGQYSVLLVDPPWRYEGASDPDRKAELHYPTMTHADLLALPVGDIAASDAIMFLWCPSPKLAEGLSLLESSGWGSFGLKTAAVWDKGGPHGTRVGLGSFFRQQHEFLLVATRGHLRPPAPANRPPSIIRAPRTVHSAKPEIVRQQIEAMYPGVRRIELFARGAAPGWDVWGLEAKQLQSR